MSILDGANTFTHICAGFFRRIREMDEFAAGGVSGCVASATLCLIISYSADTTDANDWAALVWAAATIGTLGAYIFVRGLVSQATAYNAPTRASNERRRADARGAAPWTPARELTGSAPGPREDVSLAVRQKAKAR